MQEDGEEEEASAEAEEGNGGGGESETPSSAAHRRSASKSLQYLWQYVQRALLVSKYFFDTILLSCTCIPSYIYSNPKYHQLQPAVDDLMQVQLGGLCY